jgi:hypothetical protein
LDERDLAAELGRALSCAAQHRLRRLDRDELVDLRIVREAQSGADADLEHAAAGSGEDPSLDLRAVLLLPALAERVVDGSEDSFLQRHGPHSM